jgi:hypothetical protein
MKIIKLSCSFIFMALFILVYSGCKKKEDKPTDYSASKDNANANNAFAGIWKEISTVTDSSNALRSPTSTLSGGCASATITPFDLTTWPKTVIIDFGSTNCAGADGNNRRGKITAVFTGRYLDSNTVITVTLTNYYHNDNHVEGTQIITNKGRNSAGHRVFNVVVNNAIVTYTDGTHTTWNTNQNREFYAGYTTWFNWLDDVYLITGTANGVAANGESYSLNVNTPLRVNVGCPWIVSGSLTIILASYPTYPIVCDYGSGACDAAATATLDGTTYNIYMN